MSVLPDLQRTLEIDAIGAALKLPLRLMGDTSAYIATQGFEFRIAVLGVEGAATVLRHQLSALRVRERELHDILLAYRGR